MKPRLSLLLSLGCYTLAQGICLKPSIAQVTADGTTNTTVSADGNDFTIQNGDKAGSNLFHSFQDFSVPNGGSAFFDNAADIANIFSRVTGGNISNIDGLIRANDASLFLINPAGMIFGAGARLDLGGGSFYGSSADSILFEDGEFSATDLENPPLLTINAPIGLSFRDNPGTITNNSVADNVGLQAASGATLALLGGDVNFTGGIIDSFEVNVFLGGLSEAGVIEFNEDGSINFPTDIELANITLAENSLLSVTSFGEENGSIQINANSLSLTNGSLIGAFGLGQGNTGNININTRDNIIISGFNPEGFSSGIFTNLAEGGIGNSGDINIATSSLSLLDGGFIFAGTRGAGDSGTISIDAVDSIAIDGTNLDGFASGITSTVGTLGQGNAGEIEISTENLTLTNRGQINTRTLGQGNAGDINITTDNQVEIAYGSIFSIVEAGASGNGGNINIISDSLSLTQGGQIQTSVRGETEEIPAGIGNTGNINLNVAGEIIISGVSDDESQFPSAIFSTLGTGAVGNAGNINIEASSLSLLDGASLGNSTFGEGDAGNITVAILDGIAIADEGNISSLVGQEATGSGGITSLATQSLDIFDGGRISSSLVGMGNGGNIEIIADSVSVNGETSDGFSSGIVSQVLSEGIGNGGSIEIDIFEDLSLTDGGLISAETLSESNAGDLTINASDSIEVIGLNSGLFSRTGSSGNSGTVNITTPELTIQNNAQIGVNNFIETELRVNPSGTTTRVIDRGGFSAELDPSGRISPSELESSSATLEQFFNPSEGTGNAGTVNITAANIQLSDGGSIAAISAGGDGGEINIRESERLVLRDSSNITATAAGLENIGGDGGNITIDADFIITYPRENNDITANAFGGQGGNITIFTEGIFGIQERSLNDDTNDINASSESNIGGNISINTPDVNAIQPDTDLPSNPIETQQNIAQACRSDRIAGGGGGLTIEGKGGVPPVPTAPLDSDVFLTNGKATNPNSQASYPDIKPIKTSIGDIMPARGVIKTESGEIILTAYPTDNLDRRTPSIKANCI